MVKIPDSYGMVAKPTTQTQIAPPDNLGQQTSQIIQQIGGDVMNMAIQAKYFKAKEDEAFNASQLIDFKTELSRFENDKRVALTELPATDAKTIENAKKQFTTERQKFVDEYSNKFKDNKQVFNLIKRQANIESVDFEYDVDRVISGKKKEYGQNTIYKFIYDINNRLQKGGNINKLKNELQNTLQTGYQAGLIDQQDIIRETEKQKSIIEELNRKYEATKISNMVASGKMMIDPSSAEDRKIGDLTYQNNIRNLQKQGIDPTIATANFIAKTNYVPSEVKKIWSTQLNVGSPQQKIEVANNIADLIDKNPRLQNQFNSDDIHFAMEIRNRANAGLPPAQVLEYAEKEISKYQSLDRQAKNAIIRDPKGKFKKDSINSQFKDFASDYNSWFSSNPAIEDGIKVAFETLAKDYFLGNEKATPETAFEFAKNKLKNEYSVTEVGEKKVMRYAPETFFKQYNEDTSWIKGQFANKIAEHRLLPNFKDVEKNYSLVPEPNLIAKGIPAYYIKEKKGNSGKMDLMLDNFNRPVLFAPNIKEAKFFKEAQKEIAKKRKTPLTQQEMLQILEGKSSVDNIAEAVKMGSKGRFAVPNMEGF